MPNNKTRPNFSDRMSLGDPSLEAFNAPAEETTWTKTHKKRTLWLSEEVWAALTEAHEADPLRSKSNLAEDAIREKYGMQPDPRQLNQNLRRQP